MNLAIFEGMGKPVAITGAIAAVSAILPSYALCVLSALVVDTVKLGGHAIRIWKGETPIPVTPLSNLDLAECVATVSAVTGTIASVVATVAITAFRYCSGR